MIAIPLAPFDNLGTFSSIEEGDLRWANKIKRMQNPVFFEIIGKIEEIETIAIGGRIHDIMRIQKRFNHLFSRLI